MIRETVIGSLARGKDVLDIGSVGQTDAYSLWKLYDQFGPKSLTGIDLPDAKETARVQFAVKNVCEDQRIVFGNMETYFFGVEFDLIVAGDVLAQVENQGLFLRNIRRHLRDGGQLVLTTPNAKWPTVMFRPNATHTLWHDRHTLARILAMAGFKITRLNYYFGNKPSYPAWLKPFLARQAILAICGKADGS